MSFNPKGAVPIQLDVKGSWVCEMSPDCLPPGVSPDNQEMIYAPGYCGSRPALQKVLNSPLPSGGPGNLVPTIVYGKSFVTPTGAIKNLYLDSNGTLWLEDPINSPGTYTDVFQTIPGSFCRSITAFGREYFAFSDGLHGSDFALQYDGTYFDRVTQDGPAAAPSAVSIALPASTIFSLTRAVNNVVAVTSGEHGLKVGYQTQISGVPGFDLGIGIESIIVNNEDLPGIATITMAAPHGLAPNSYVSITGVVDEPLGTSVTAWSLAVNALGQSVLSMTTSTPHGLQVGMLVNVSTNFGIVQELAVNSVPTGTTVTFLTIGGTTSTGTTNATLTLPFPLPRTLAGNPNGPVVEVLSCPTSTTFQIAFNFEDATWLGSGAVYLAWDGTFYVLTVPSSTSFTYQQYGPNATAASGTVIPWGQISPGLHQCRQFFITRQGQITRPSPPVTFMANGGQYVSVSNLLTGPANIVARGVEFTGAQGSYFFYIPVAAQVNGQLVSTSTVINDNTTTSAILDFGDATLYSAQATSVPSNDIASQVVLDGSLGFADYKQRLVAFGQRNTVNNFLNLGFEGGPTGILPTGWATALTGTAAVSVVAGRTPGALSITLNAHDTAAISQSAYQDAYGAPILQPNTSYKIRLWLKPSTLTSGLIFTVSLTSASTGFSATATILNAQMSLSGSYLEAVFPVVMPLPIPQDLTLSLTAAASGTVFPHLIIDEIEIIDAETPYLDMELFASYPGNPEAFSGVTGLFGPPDDTHKVMDFAIIRNTPYILTQDPEGRLHQVTSGNTEPSGWDVAEVDSSCGALSAFCLTKSQSDNRSSSGGEEWFAWASMSGPRIFGGSIAHKIGQEIQPAWFDETNKAFPQINMAAALTAWALNDPTTRTIYFGLPLGSATAPSIVYPMNYRELDTAEVIASSPPFHPSFAGRLIATDNTRKWTRWNMTINGAALMYRAAGVLSTVLFGGNGRSYGAAAGFGNIYALNPAKYTDDDYGQIYPYYVTHAMPDSGAEMGLQLDSGRKLLAYLSAMIPAVGHVTITPLCDSLSNPWPLSVTRSPGSTPKFDLEWGGGNATAQRMFFKIASSPLAGQTDNAFTLRKLTPWFKKAKLLVRGAAQ